jgi:hypothetical protein
MPVAVSLQPYWFYYSPNATTTFDDTANLYNNPAMFPAFFIPN